MNPQIFKKRFGAAKAKKDTNWEALYREVMELFCPNRENFHENIPGQRKGRQVYTASPYVALDKASNNIHSSLTPHMKRWINLKAGRLVAEENRDDANTELDKIRNIMFDHIFASNFDLAISEFYKDVIIGTGALMVTGTPENPLIFTAIPLNELYITTGALGTVDTVFRRYKIKLGNIMDTWDDAVIPDSIKDTIKTNPDKEMYIIEGTIPAEITVMDKATQQKVKKKGYKYYVMLEKQGDTFMVEREMPVSPWIIARWSVMSGEDWGRGPAIICHNDAKTLNQFIKLHMQSMELVVHPMYTIVDDGVINISAIRIGPGAMLPVSANDGVFGPSIKPLASGGNFQAGQIEIQRLEGTINDQMYTEPLGPVNLPVKTATEISIRQQELAKRIGSAYGRLQYELIKPLVNLCLYQLDKYGIVNMNNFKVDGHNIAIDAVSPLAQSQQQDEMNNVVRYVEFAVGAFGPQVAMSLMKPEEVMDFVGEQLNIPPSVKMTAQDKQKAQDLIQAMSMQQQAANVPVQ